MENVIYIGRAVGGVMHNQLYVRRPVMTIARLEKTFPLIGALFVPCDEYEQALRELETPGSDIYLAAEQLRRGKLNG